MLGGKRNATRTEEVNPAVNMPHGRPRCGLENTMKIDLKERERGCVEWINLA